MKTLLISGKAGSGKDTVAKIIESILHQRNKEVLILHFADLVKFYAEHYWGWNRLKDKDGRYILQYIGTELMRRTFPTYWAEIIGKFLYALQLNGLYDYCIISDWRFINEFDVVSEYAEHLTAIRIERPNYNNDNLTYEQKHHISETQLDNFPFDWIVENSGTLTDLEDSLNIILEHI